MSSEEVGAHIVALTMYLLLPNKARLDELAAIEAVKNHIVHYIGSDKLPDEITAADIEAAREIAQNERVVQIVTRNILSTEIEDIQFEMAVVAGMAPGSEDPIEHIVVSWPKGEHPTPEQVEKVLDIVLAVAGMAHHQAYAVLHGDTDNVHLHIALNRVDPVTGERVQIGRNIERSIETLHQATAIIEHRQGWRAQEKALYRADDEGCYDRDTGVRVRDANMLPCASAADQTRIRQWRAEQKLERKLTAAARDFERRTGIESLQRRVIATAAPVFREAKTWDEVHRGLAGEGMRVRMLTAGAVIVCGDCEIAASTAWGGASGGKLVERLGPFEEAAEDVVVQAFEDRVMPNLHEAAQKRRARAAVKASTRALNESIAHVRAKVGERYRQRVADDPRARAEALNDVRQQASGELAELRHAVEQFELQERARLRRKRAAKAERQSALEDAADQPLGMLIGVKPVSPPISDDLPLKGYDIVRIDGRHDYYRGDTIFFKEHRDRIELHALDDPTLRDALRLAQAKWGTVVAIGDDRFLDRIARLAVDEGVALSNPQLQDRMVRMHNNRYLERQLENMDDQSVASSAAAERSAPTVSFSLPKLLTDYAPQFHSWLKLHNDPTVPAAKAGAAAAAIMMAPELKSQLAELVSQQFAFAIDLRRAGRRYLSLSQKLAADNLAGLADEPFELSGGVSPPDVFEPSAAKLEHTSIKFAPLRLTAVSSGLAEINAEVGVVQEIDNRYRRWADRDRRKRINWSEQDCAAALRARVGEANTPPRHIAQLLLRVSGRTKTGRSQSAKSTDERDRQEIAALSPDPVFAQMLRRATERDDALLERLAHRPKSVSASEMAYNRASHWDRRREIAEEWADLIMDGLLPAADLLRPRDR